MSGRQRTGGKMMIRKKEWRKLQPRRQAEGLKIFSVFLSSTYMASESLPDSLIISPEPTNNPCLLILDPKYQPVSVLRHFLKFSSPLSLYCPAIVQTFTVSSFDHCSSFCLVPLSPGLACSNLSKCKYY